MSETIRLKASDGHELDAYVARPAGTPIVGLVVVQEAFGVNGHIRFVTDGFARDGFLAVAPALFDRIEQGVELRYEGQDREKGIGIARQLNPDNAVKDIAAALDFAKNETGKKCGVIGYCLGGTFAWLSATRLERRRGCRILRRIYRPLRAGDATLSRNAALRQTRQAHSQRRGRQSSGGASRGANLLVRRRSRIQLQRPRFLQSRGGKAGAGTIAGVLEEELRGIGFLNHRGRQSIGLRGCPPGRQNTSDELVGHGFPAQDSL